MLEFQLHHIYFTIHRKKEVLKFLKNHEGLVNANDSVV